MIRVAILSPIAWRTPPRAYGPWEQMASAITECLVAKGVDVTLFASGDSITKAKLASCIGSPYAEQDSADVKVQECLHISHLMERAADFDIIHNHYDFLPLTYSRLISTPMVTTIHGFSSPDILPVYQKYNKSCYYASISYANRSPLLQYAANIYNGIATQDFPFCSEAGEYLLFFGRIHPEKGTLEAILLAKRCGKKLIIAGLIQDQEYFNRSVQPFIDSEQVIYAGNCGPLKRQQLLGHAQALLHLILFDEPFGLSVVEAMCCGTPVIAFDRGSMPELIVHGKTGFLVTSPEEAADAVNNLPSIVRADCRAWVLSAFSQERMAGDYLQLYHEILKR